MLDELTTAYKLLTGRYRAYFRNPKPELNLWRECCDAHERVIKLLDDAAAGHIDVLIEKQIEAGNATTSRALKTLVDATKKQVETEEILAPLVGFKVKDAKLFAAKARQALQKQRVGVSPTETAEIRQALETLHGQVRHAFVTSVREARGEKDAHRNDAAEFALNQLWMIGTIIVNAERPDLFNVSYATSVGMASVRTLQRGELRIPTHERPAGSELEAKAA